MLPLAQHNIILFELDFDVKFPLLGLLQFLSDSKSTILCVVNILPLLLIIFIRYISIEKLLNFLDLFMLFHYQTSN